MTIAYAWTCKYCEHGNSAGTNACAVCRRAAIARAIDVDPPTAEDSINSEKRRAEFEALPDTAKKIVTGLWIVAVAAGITAQVAWSAPLMFATTALAIVCAVAGVLITKLCQRTRMEEKHDA